MPERTIREALKDAKRCYLRLTLGNSAYEPSLPSAYEPSLPVAKYTIRQIIDDGWDGEDDSIGLWRLTPDGSLIVSLAT